MILIDTEIKRLCVDVDVPMIYPFFGASINKEVIEKPGVNGSVPTMELTKVPSFGLSSCGYDVRLAPEFKLFTKPNDGRIIDILNFKEEDIVDVVERNSVVIPPGGLLLGRTLEYFNIPDNIVVTVVGKSSWARLGASVIVTPMEPGWSGELVVEVINGTNLPLKIYAGVGIAQLVFNKIPRPEVTYSDRNGKYQGQTGVTGSKL